DELCHALLQPEPQRRPSDRDVLRRLGIDDAVELAAPRSLFVGREEELHQLNQAFARAANGVATAVFVTGESGVGKSALVRRFLARVASGDAVVLAGRCYERESTPYKAIDEVIDALSRHLGALPPKELEPLLPDLIDLVVGVFPALRRVGAVAEAVE